MAQSINPYDTTAMNVAVTSVVKCLDTTVSGVQSALVLYSLVMASFMLIGGKLGDVWAAARRSRWASPCTASAPSSPRSAWGCR
jgi:MFS family permease